MLEQHDAAFKFYLKVYNNIHSPNRQAVGFELANMIFTGSVIINTEGGLIPLNENYSMEARAKLGLNTETMMWRAITAYEYLHGNNSEEATLLRRYLDNCLKGELSVSVNSKNAWNITAMKKFKEYYSKKNLVMLTEEAYSASLNFILDNLEPEQKQPSLYSPRFVGGKAPKFENLKNDNNNHSQKL